MIYKNVNGTQKLVTNIRKPKKWRRFEYLESSGTLYIDTGINPKVKPRAVVSMMFLNNSDKDYWGNKNILGSSYIANFSNRRLTYYRYGATSYAAAGSATTANVIHEWDVSKQVYLDGNLVYTSPNTYTYNTSQGNIEIFKAARSTTLNSTYRLYSFKLYDGDTLVRDFVPALFNEEYGLWDLVQNRFYGNKGTGTFTVGPEIGKPYEEIEKLIIPNTLLPSGVELYDYVQNDGSLWINTGIIASNTTKVETKFESSITTPISIYGSSTDSSSGFRLFWLNNVLYAASGGYRAENYGTNPTANTVYTVIHDLNTLTINSISYNTGLGNAFGNNLLLMKDPYSSSYYFKGKFYYCKIYNNDLLIRNFLPCTYFGEPGMWDTVTKLFYRNLGTGEFILGNKIVLLDHEYLENTTNAYINLQYIPTNNTGIKIETSPNRVASTQVVLGRGASSNTSRWWINFTSNNNISLGWNSTYSPGTYEANSWYKIEYNYLNSRGCVVNDVSNTYNYPTLKLTSDPIGLFANYTSPSSTVFRGKVKYVQITEEDKIVRDFVPCSYNGTTGMWDKIECKFYESANSNTFTLGRKLSGEIPIWVLKNSLTNSTIGAYINTGVFFDSTKNYVFETKFKTSTASKRYIVLGSYDGTPQINFEIYNDNKLRLWITSEVDKSMVVNANLDHTLRIEYIAGGTWNVTLDDTSKTFTKAVSGTNSKNFRMFCDHRSSSWSTFNNPITYYYMYIYENGEMIRKLVPATMGGRPGLYDKVNHKMYFNANSSGNFTVE